MGIDCAIGIKKGCCLSSVCLSSFLSFCGPGAVFLCCLFVVVVCWFCGPSAFAVLVPVLVCVSVLFVLFLVAVVLVFVCPFSTSELVMCIFGQWPCASKSLKL